MIICKGRTELETMRQANLIVARVHEEAEKTIREGVTTAEIDEMALEIILAADGKPVFKGYRGFPGNVCVSINDEVVHGIPGPRRLNKGDIVSLDVGVRFKGYVGDAARTYPVGEISEESRRLLKITEESLYRGIEQVVLGNRVSDISSAIQGHVEKNGFSIVEDFVGHGVGRSLHEEPQVPNFGKPGRGPRLKKGMVLAIEPMVNARGPAVKVLADKWTAVTVDGGNSAHFEHSVAVTDNGPWVLSELN